MIVCVCKYVSERQLQSAIAEGADNVRSLSRQTGCGTQCGRCIPAVREMLNVSRRSAGIDQQLVELPLLSETMVAGGNSLGA